MILPITLYGNPILRKISEDITPDYPKLQDIITNMWETMYIADGVGLAAPQVGLNARIFVIDATALTEEDPQCNGFKKTFINARMIEQAGEEWAFNEGCLSLPGIREDVNRQARIKIQYQDENFVTHVEEFDGTRARVIQHEYDHLDGKLFIDHVNMLRKRLMKKKLLRIESGDIDVAYKVKYNNHK